MDGRERQRRRKAAGFTSYLEDMDYYIALIFRGSKFLRIAVFENLVEIIL